MRKKRPSLTPYEWREKHPRCNFCQYVRLISPICCADYYKCAVKDKIIEFVNMPRPLCKCYKVRPEERFDKEMAQPCVKLSLGNHSTEKCSQQKKNV